MPRHPSPNRCQFCRERKKMCDGQIPCHACKKAQIQCVYHIPRPNCLDATAKTTTKRHYLRPQPAKLKEPTEAIQKENSWHGKVEEESHATGIDNEIPLTVKDTAVLQLDGELNLKPGGPDYHMPSIESPTSQGNISIVPNSEADDTSDSTASSRPIPYASRYIGKLEARVLHALDNILQWDCIAFCLIDGDRFKGDLQTGCTTYCSPALVDALLALSVVVFRHDIINETSSGEAETSTWEVFSATLANKVIQALHRGAWLPAAIPNIQALGVLALYCDCHRWKDMSRNFAMEFAKTIREYCLQSADPESALATKCRITASTYCGAISMNRVLVQIQKYNMCLSLSLRETRAKHTKLDNESNDQSWTEHLFQATLANEHFVTNPDLHGHDIYGVAAELYQLIEQVFKTCCVLETKHTFAAATATYFQCLEWYHNFFRYSEAYTGREPFVLFVHTYYHFCILSLFTPYVTGMALVSDGSPPGEICKEAANIILKLMKHHGWLAGDTEPLGLMKSFKNASLGFLDFYNAVK